VGYKDYEADKQFHIINSRKLLKIIESYKDKGTLLEVGCALGFFLEEAKARGWDVYGTELSDYAGEKARGRGLNVFSGDIIDAGFENNFFDAITCLGTIEHLQDPAAIVKKVSQILKDDGLFVISTPDAGGFIGGRRFQYKPKEHLYYFTKKTIMKTLVKEDFKILLINREWVTKPVHFIVERFEYYFPGSKGFARGIETVFKRLGILNTGITIPTGQMIVYAQKKPKLRYQAELGNEKK
jgi:2-polyprenyl-3-methyl-5-hydroxy-6-metoxy-1,4-benzoquinol methylase